MLRSERRQRAKEQESFVGFLIVRSISETLSFGCLSSQLEKHPQISDEFLFVSLKTKRNGKFRQVKKKRASNKGVSKQTPLYYMQRNK
uniref:Uncharacterized protein n=1 Tax=Noccaea caerulescens TaxID=107243 RepID=A0A1J3GWQ4_NOCCA